MNTCGRLLVDGCCVGLDSRKQELAAWVVNSIVSIVCSHFVAELTGHYRLTGSML